MVSLDEEGQVIIATSVVIAILVLGLGAVIIQQNQVRESSIDSNEGLGDYVYYDVRETYGRVLSELYGDESVDNPFNHEEIGSLEKNLSSYCLRNGYFLLFENKTFIEDEEVAEVELVFFGDGIEYREVIRYDL